MNLRLAIVLASLFTIVAADPPTWVTCEDVRVKFSTKNTPWTCLFNGSPLGAGSSGVTYAFSFVSGGNPTKAAVKVVNFMDPWDVEKNSMELWVLQNFGKGGFQNIVKFYGAEKLERDGNVVLMMAQEFCENGTLESFYKKNMNKFKDPDYAMRRFLDMLIGVKNLHDHGVAHADLKIANLVVDSSQTVKVIDFDFSYKVKPDSKGPCLGSPIYEDPRHFLKGPYGTCYLDLKSDIYSLGIILWELMTSPGNYPIKAKKMEELVTNLRIGTYVLPSGMPKHAAFMIASCLLKEASNRPTIDQLIKATKHFLDSAQDELIVETNASNDSSIGWNSFELIPKVPQDSENQNLQPNGTPKNELNLGGNQGQAKNQNKQLQAKMVEELNAYANKLPENNGQNGGPQKKNTIDDAPVQKGKGMKSPAEIKAQITGNPIQKLPMANNKYNLGGSNYYIRRLADSEVQESEPEPVQNEDGSGITSDDLVAIVWVGFMGLTFLIFQAVAAWFKNIRNGQAEPKAALDEPKDVSGALAEVTVQNHSQTSLQMNIKI